MDSLKVCGIVIFALCVCLIFKNTKSEYSIFIKLIITISISLLSISVIYPVLNYINEITYNTNLEKYFPSLIKSLGIAIAVQITSDICKDVGEEALANRVSLFGRCEIVIICIPIIKELLSLCNQIME